MQDELILFRKMQEGDWCAFNSFFESYSERLYLYVTQQDCIDGAFFLMNKSIDFKENPLMRQNLYWLKRQ